MTLPLRSCLLLLAFGTVACTQHSTSAGGPVRALSAISPMTQEGRLSTVRLIRAWRLDANALALRGAPDGVGFEFLIVRKPGVEGHFTITELRDVTVEQQGYQQRTREAANTVFEPRTVVDDLKDVRTSEGQSLDEAYGIPEEGASVMRTLLFGASLPWSGALRVVPKLGWGNETEPFEFNLRLDDLRTQPQAY